MNKIIGIILLSFVFIQARATTLGLETSSGSIGKSVSLSADGDFNTPKDPKVKEDIFNWDLSLVKTQTAITTPSDDTVYDNTTDFMGGAGVYTTTRWSFGLDLLTSTTPEEHLKSSGPKLYAGKTWHYGENLKEKEFDPSFGVALQITQLGYQADFTGSITGPRGRLTKNFHGTEAIAQKSTALKLKWTPLEWLTVRMTPTTYTYDKDVAAFVQTLDSHKAIGDASSGMSTSLDGFASSSMKSELDFYFLADWEIDLSHQSSKSASDGGTSTSDKLMASYKGAENWTFGAGFEVVKDPATETEDASKETASILSIEAEF